MVEWAEAIKKDAADAALDGNGGVMEEMEVFLLLLLLVVEEQEEEDNGVEEK